MADKNSDVKNINVGGTIGGEIHIAGPNIVQGYTTEQVSSLISQIQTRFQPKPFDGRNPYKGLDVFEEEDADLFFGRESLVQDLVDRLKESRSLFITGPSGSGKSSLVRAGLIPALKQGAIKNLHSERWLYETMKPGREPLEALDRGLSRLKSPELGDYFRTHANQPGVLNACAESVLSGRKDQRFVLFVDQFEEVFTQISREEERQTFINLLTDAAAVENGRVVLLFAMRADYIPNCAAYPQLNEVLNRQFVQVGAMQPEELVRAIAQPALRVGLSIDPDLVVRIINDMRSEPGALPLMQFTLKELFDSQQEKGGMIALTLEDYLRQGGIHKALERHADSAFSRLNESEQQLARVIFSSLIEIGRGTQDTRRTALFEELIPANAKPEEVQTVIQKLADARLIITDEQAGKDTVTLAHEKLIDAWPWLKRLVNENRDLIALQNEIAEDAKDWADHNRDVSYLYTGARLENARVIIEVNRLVLGGLAQEFISTSLSRRRFSLGRFAQDLIGTSGRQPRKDSPTEAQQSSVTPDQVEPATEQVVEEQSDVFPPPEQKQAKFVIDPVRLAALIESNRFVNNRSQKLLNDQAMGDDRLGIADEVAALADTLLLRDIDPPVAVGIMGGWGSGKSFVMHLIKKRVAETRAKEVKKAGTIRRPKLMTIRMQIECLPLWDISIKSISMHGRMPNLICGPA